MLTICHLYSKDDAKVSEELRTLGTAEKMREEYRYVIYDGKYYEMIFCSPGYGVYDQECTFAEIDSFLHTEWDLL
jgi:hypothetical protein